MIIGGIGLGLFFLIILWIIALIIFVLGIKLQNNIAWISLASATAFTIVLLLIPLESSTKVVETGEVAVKDYNIIYKGILVSFLTLSVLLGFIAFFILHCIESVHP